MYKKYRMVVIGLIAAGIIFTGDELLWSIAFSVTGFTVAVGYPRKITVKETAYLAFGYLAVLEVYGTAALFGGFAAKGGLYV